MNTEKIAAILEAAPRPVITVAGDYCLDKYLYIDRTLDEPSVETGLTAYQIREKRLFPGVGGTIASNLRALGAEVHAVGIYGEDGEGFELIQALKERGIQTEGMTLTPKRYTNTYTKPMRQNENGEWIELNRHDIRNREPVSEETVKETIQKLRGCASQSRALIISDQFTYESGSVVTVEFRDAVSRLHLEFPDLFILADSRSYVEKYQNVVVKCNADELFKAVRRLDGDETRIVAADDSASNRRADLEAAAQRLARRNCRPVVVTLGEHGAFIADGEEIVSVPAQKVEPPIDICGAGDATDAGIAFGRALGLSLPDAAYLAGIVSSITIKQIGVTGTASPQQVLEVLRKDRKNP